MIYTYLGILIGRIEVTTIEANPPEAMRNPHRIIVAGLRLKATLYKARVCVCARIMHTYTKRARSFGSQLFTIIYIYIYIPREVLTTGQRKCLDSVTPHYRGHPSPRHPSLPLCRIARYIDACTRCIALGSREAKPRGHCVTRARDKRAEANNRAGKT